MAGLVNQISPLAEMFRLSQKGKFKMNMSTHKVEALAREFHYNGVRIPDPGPELTVEQVRDLL